MLILQFSLIKGTTIMAVADAFGLPMAAHVQSASPHEVKLVVGTIAKRFIKYPPKRLIMDKAYDSDSQNQQLESQLGI